MFVLQLVLFLFFQVGTTISSSAATTATAITAVMAAMQVASGYLRTTQSFYYEKTFTIRGRAYRENWQNLPTFDTGCLRFYIYTDSDVVLTEGQISIMGNVDYSINFNGFQNGRYGIRMLFHTGKSCYGLQFSDLNVVYEGDYYMVTHEKIYTAEADADNVLWKNVALKKYENGQCGENYQCQCSEQCQMLYSTGYYCIPRPTCPYLEYPQWVCASDGKTYYSECSMLANRDCSNGRVYLVRRGKCSDYFTTPKWNEIDYPSRDNSWSLSSRQDHLKIILGVFCPLIAVIIVLIFIRRRYVSRKKTAASSYRRFPESNPTSTSSSATTNKIDHEFFVGDPVKYEQPGSERVITTNVVYLERDDYHTAEDVTVDQPE